MRPSLRLVIGGLCAVVVLVVAVITLAITYTVSLSTVRDIGKKHALALATTARVQTENFFDRPAEDLDAQAAMYLRPMLDLPSALPDQTDPLAREVITQSIWQAQVTSGYGYTAFGVIFEDASGCNGYPLGDTLQLYCRFVHEWPAGNMATTYRWYHLANASEGPSSTNFTVNLDARFAAYSTAKLLAGSNRNGMWYPVSMYQSGDILSYMWPAAKPMYNTSGGFIGFATLGRPLAGISGFLREVRGTPNTEAFAVQDDGYLVGSTHATEFFTITQSTASAQVPSGCASSSSTTYDTDSRTFHGCRASASQFAYAPLRAVASDAAFLHTQQSTATSLDVDGDRYFVVSTPVRNAYRFFGLNIVLCMPESDILGDIVQGRNTAIGVTVGVFVAAALLSFGLVYALLQPLSDVSRRMLDTARLKETEDDREYSSLAEIQDLQKAYTNMNTAIKSFTRYVPRDVVKDLMASGQLCEIKMAPLMCTMLFVDIAGFTTVCERVPPDALSALVSQYFDRASRIVMEHDGLIDKFIGDCIMAVWGAPFGVSNQEVKATLAGKLLDRETMVEPLSTAWDEAGELLRVRVGISTGEVLAGNMGSADRMNYTVIGDPVNLAARLESLNKQFDTRVMVSEMTAEGLGGVFVLRLLMPIAVVGKDKPVKAYEVLGLAREVSPADAAAIASDEASGNMHTSFSCSGLDMSENIPDQRGSPLSPASVRADRYQNQSQESDLASAQSSNGKHFRKPSKRPTLQMLRDAKRKTASTLPVVCDVDSAVAANRANAAVGLFVRGDFARAVAVIDDLLGCAPTSVTANSNSTNLSSFSEDLIAMVSPNTSAAAAAARHAAASASPVNATAASDAPASARISVPDATAEVGHAELTFSSKSLLIVKQRCEEYLKHGKPAGFDGTFRAVEK